MAAVVGRRRRGLLLAAAFGGALIGAGAPAGAQDQGAGARVDEAAEQLRAADGTGDVSKRMEQLRAVPSSQVEQVELKDRGMGITPATAEAAFPERMAPPAPANPNRPETLPELEGKAAATLLARPEYRGGMRELQRCADDIAVERRVKPSAVTAGEVLLRWTVRRDGRVQDAEVVAVAPTDPDVMTCVHRKLSAWQVTPPAEPYRVSRQLRFAK